MIKRTRGEKIFAVFNVIFLCLIGLACLIPRPSVTRSRLPKHGA